MKKKSLLIVLVVLVVFGLAAWFFVFKGKTSGNKCLDKNGLETNAGNCAVATTGNTVAEKVSDSVKGTFQQLLSTGKNMRCSFSQKAEGTQSDSTTYLSGTKFRVDSIITGSGNEVTEFHQISDGEWIYMWGTGFQGGLKMKYTDFQKQSGEQTNTNSEAFKKNTEMMKDVNYECLPWVVDTSKFNVPTNVTFQDLTEMMKGLGDTTKNLSKELCANCNQLDTAEQIASCKSALKCE
jgi:hypothetical protein